MPVKRRYLKIGHSDIRILPIVIDVEDEQWFAEEYSELLKLFNINSKLLLNFSVQTPDERITKPVKEQIISVSINGSKIDTNPSSTECLVLEVACAIGADP